MIPGVATDVIRRGHSSPYVDISGLVPREMMVLTGLLSSFDAGLNPFKILHTMCLLHTASTSFRRVVLKGYTWR